MKISKLRIKNLFGITEFEADGQSLELLGANGTGKTSVLDAIRLALTNKTDREFTVKNGETEGEIFIEFDNGIAITRKPRTNMTDYKKITQDGKEVQRPEEFLNNLFSKLPLDPIKFINLDEKEQNRILLDLIKYDWDLNKIEKWFGEVPPAVDYSKTIIEVLAQIAAEDGFYYQQRAKINREIREKEAVVEEMVRSIPEGFNAEKWRDYDLGKTYSKIEAAIQNNAKIDKAQEMQANYETKIAAFKSDKETEIAKIKQSTLDEITRQKTKIASLEAELAAAKERMTHIGENETAKIEAAEANFQAHISKFNEELKVFQPYISSKKQDVQALKDEADTAGKMKIHLSEFDRMTKINDEIDSLRAKSSEFTEKIELARTLPAEILNEAELPLQNMTTDGKIVLINNLPISNLSEGEKLNLCVDVAIKNDKGLQIVLIDGVEKLSSSNRAALFAKCKEAGLQFIATRTTDEPELTVIEL